jgi:hypothetical protein
MPPLHESSLRNGGPHLASAPALARFLKVLDSFGVINAYEHLELEETKPETCMSLVSKSLDLLGIGGRKWTLEPWFEAKLEWLSHRSGHVRFLVHEQMEDIPEEMAQYQKLVSAYPKSFSVRLYSTFPVFRLVVIDGSTAIISHYGHDVIDGASNLGGWKSPQLICDCGKEWSLGTAFATMFDGMWDSSREVKPLDVKPEGVKRTRREFTSPTTES